MSNRDAFLAMLAWSEGTTRVAGSDNGYNVLVGGTLFDGYTDHPRQKVFLPSLQIYSTAAGRYQIIEGTFDEYKKQLNLPDFSPAAQDAIALALIGRAGALTAVDAGMLQTACALCNSTWASLPGSNYGQPESKSSDLETAFTGAGGTLASQS